MDHLLRNPMGRYARHKCLVGRHTPWGPIPSTLSGCDGRTIAPRKPFIDRVAFLYRKSKEDLGRTIPWNGLLHSLGGLVGEVVSLE